MLTDAVRHLALLREDALRGGSGADQPAARAPSPSPDFCGHGHWVTDTFQVSVQNETIIGYRADATNKRIWADEKLYVCEITTTCLLEPPGQHEKTEDMWECLWQNKRFADFQVFGVSCQSGKFQPKMLKKSIWIRLEFHMVEIGYGLR